MTTNEETMTRADYTREVKLWCLDTYENSAIDEMIATLHARNMSVTDAANVIDLVMFNDDLTRFEEAFEIVVEHRIRHRRG